MKNLKPTVIILFIIISLSPAKAQLMDKLKRAVGNTLEDQAVDQINKGLSKGLTKASDKMWESLYGIKKSTMDSMIVAEQNDPKAFEKMMGSMYGGGAAITVADEYDFESKLVYKLTTEIGKKSNTVDYTMLINPNQEYMATKMGSMEVDGKKSNTPYNVTTIMDYGKDAMIMIMEDQKTANILPMNMMKATGEVTEQTGNVSVKKSGNTKKILGYTCDEYIMKSDEADGSVWIAKDVEFVSKSLLTNMGNSSFAKNSDWLDEKGMMMEMDMLINEEKSKKQSHMTMTMISMEKKSNKYVMADYKTMNFGGSSTK